MKFLNWLLGRSAPSLGVVSPLQIREVRLLRTLKIIESSLSKIDKVRAEKLRQQIRVRIAKGKVSLE